MLRHATIALTLLLTLVVGIPAVAQSVQQEPIELRDDSDALEHLFKRKYSSRQQATMELWRQREESRDEVQEAARSSDPEVSGRAQWILRQWRRGSLPDTPPEVSRLLERLDGPAAVERLLEGGHFAAAIVAVEESAGTVDREAIQARVTTALNRRFPIYVHHALANDSLPELLKLIDLVADSKELVVCRVQLMREMGIEIQPAELLPSSRSLSNVDVERATALTLITLGQIAEAIAVAKQSADKDLLHQCRMIGGQWAESAMESAELARAAEAGSYEQTRYWCLTLIAAERAGNKELIQEAVQFLSSPDPQGDDLAAELRWKCLASHGEVAQAFKILDKLSPSASASVAIDSSRTERAFEVLGFPLERLDLEITQWVDAAIEAQRVYKLDELCLESQNILALMQCLISIGRDDAGWFVAKRLCESDVHVGTLLLREYVLSTLTMTKRTDWLVPLAVMEGENVMGAASPHTIARTLDVEGETVEILVDALTRVLLHSSLKERLHAAAELLRGEIPAGFDQQTGYQIIFDHVTMPRTSRDLRRRSVQLKDISANEGLVQMFLQHGQAELAMSCRQKMAESGDINALFKIAEHQIDAGRAATAEELLDLVFKRIESQGRISGRLSGTDETSLAVKAVIGKWLIARRTGDVEKSNQLLREIRLCLCSPSTQLRSAVAEYLADRDETELAMEAYETLLPMTVLGTEDKTGLYDVARSYSMLARKTKVAESARWFDLAIGGTLDSMNYRPGAYVTLPLYVQRWSIEAALQTNDRDLAEQSIERLMELDPMDIDFAERLLPEMRKAGMADLADQALDQIIATGIAYVKRFPFDAMTANNLAWVAAMNERHLDDALLLSESAVYAEPESAIYRDTLAEVLFLKGRKTEALQVEQACLLDDPTQWHLHEQVRKYADSIDGK
jgi:tetratricopeptide (TPR) repeat protein